MINSLSFSTRSGSSHFHYQAPLLLASTGPCPALMAPSPNAPFPLHSPPLPCCAQKKKAVALLCAAGGPIRSDLVPLSVPVLFVVPFPLSPFPFPIPFLCPFPHAARPLPRSMRHSLCSVSPAPSGLRLHLLGGGRGRRPSSLPDRVTPRAWGVFVRLACLLLLCRPRLPITSDSIILMHESTVSPSLSSILLSSPRLGFPFPPYFYATPGRLAWDWGSCLRSSPYPPFYFHSAYTLDQQNI